LLNGGWEIFSQDVLVVAVTRVNDLAEEPDDLICGNDFALSNALHKNAAKVSLSLVLETYQVVNRYPLVSLGSQSL